MSGQRISGLCCGKNINGELCKRHVCVSKKRQLCHHHRTQMINYDALVRDAINAAQKPKVWTLTPSQSVPAPAARPVYTGTVRPRKEIGKTIIVNDIKNVHIERGRISNSNSKN